MNPGTAKGKEQAKVDEQLRLVGVGRRKCRGYRAYGDESRCHAISFYEFLECTVLAWSNVYLSASFEY